MAEKARVKPGLKPVPWPTVLTLEERGIRLYEASWQLRHDNNLSYEAMGKDLGMSGSTVCKHFKEPSIEFAIKCDYLFGVDLLEVYPELGFLRDRWISELRDHLELIKAAADLNNPKMIKELAEACEFGIARYSSPELVQEFKRLRGEAVVNAVKAGVQGERRQRFESYQDKRCREHAQAVNTQTTNR
ncbi:MAG: helix-turn-helix transcriptional regulator [Flavobacteriales bacterium]|nr:helix-turn-helix transcriptional regulator [Flavobacteriales bacterium]